MKKIGIDLLYIKKNEVSGVKKLGEELVDGFGNPIKSLREMKKYETDELFKKN